MTREEILEYKDYLLNKLKKDERVLGVYWFGSSVDSENPNDLDLLIVSEENLELEDTDKFEYFFNSPKSVYHGLVKKDPFVVVAMTEGTPLYEKNNFKESIYFQLSEDFNIPFDELEKQIKTTIPFGVEEGLSEKVTINAVYNQISSAINRWIDKDKMFEKNLVNTLYNLARLEIMKIKKEIVGSKKTVYEKASKSMKKIIDDFYKKADEKEKIRYVEEAVISELDYVPYWYVEDFGRKYGLKLYGIRIIPNGIYTVFTDGQKYLMPTPTPSRFIEISEDDAKKIKIKR